MSHREVFGLKQAFMTGAPSVAQRAEAKRSAAQTSGLKYQAKVTRVLQYAAKPLGITVKPGQWFKYTDINGYGYCQPDIMLTTPEHIWIIEVKLTYTPEADSQLRRLYLPVVRRADRLDREISGIILCKYLTPGVAARRIVPLGELLSPKYSFWQPARPLPVVHWIGRGPILHSKRQLTQPEPAEDAA